MSEPILTAAPVAAQPAAAYMPSARHIRIGVIIVIVLIVVWVVATWHKFASSPWGQALKDGLGILGTVLYSMLNNPLTWILGIGLVLTLGPTVLKYTKGSLERLYKRVKAAIAGDEAETDPKDKLSDVQKKIVTDKLITEAKIETINENPKLNTTNKTAAQLNDDFVQATKSLAESTGTSDEDVNDAEDAADTMIKDYPAPSG